MKPVPRKPRRDSGRTAGDDDDQQDESERIYARLSR
jgi:hypothetical protein